MKFSHLFLLISSLSGSLGFAQSKAGFDVSDTVFLWPIDAARQPVPRVTLAESDKSPSLIEKAQLEDVLAAAKTFSIQLPMGLKSFSTLEDWKVVAFRYDPCSPDTRGPKESECMQELRLVAQPTNEAVGPVDTALHLIYDLGHGEPKSDDPVIADLLDANKSGSALAKVNTAGRALGVHPVLSAAMTQNKPEIAAPIIAFLRKYAKSEKLKKITMMGLKNGSEASWTFFGGDIVQGKWTPGGIANLPEDEGKRIDFDLNSSDRLFFPVPLETKASTYGFFHRETLVDGDIEGLRETLHTIENPQLTNRNTTDCLSCHSATTLKLNTNTMAPKFVEGQTMVIPRGITGFPEARLLQRHRLHWNLRSLGYFSSLPTLSMRTVNEAALVADRLNTLLGLTNPGPDCSAVATPVLSCIENATPNPSISAAQITADCLKQCKAAPSFPSEESGTEKPVVEDPTGLGQTISIQSKFSQKCLQPRGSVNSSMLATADCDGSNAQKFRIEAFKEGADHETVRLVNVASSLCVDISGPSVANGAFLHMWSCHGNLSQAVSLKQRGEAHAIELLHSGKCLDIEGPSANAGVRTHQWTCLGNASQDWILKP